MSVFIQGASEISRHYQGAKNFEMGNRLRLETFGWRMPDFSERPVAEREVEDQRARLLRTPLVRRDRDYLFREDLINHVSVVFDKQLPGLTEVSSVLEVFRLGGSYELVQQLWGQFSPNASCVIIEVCWSRNEVLVSIRICLGLSTYWLQKITNLIQVFNIVFCLQSVLLNGTFPRILSRTVGWAKPYGQLGNEFEEGAEDTLVFIQM